MKITVIVKPRSREAGIKKNDDGTYTVRVTVPVVSKEKFEIVSTRGQTLRTI